MTETINEKRKNVAKDAKKSDAETSAPEKGQKDSLHSLAEHIIRAAGLSSDDLMSFKPIFDAVVSHLCIELESFTTVKLHAEVDEIEPISFTSLAEIIGQDNLIVPGYIEQWSSELLIVINPHFLDILTSAFFGGNKILEDIAEHEKEEEEEKGQTEKEQQSKTSKTKISEKNTALSLQKTEEEEIYISPVERQVGINFANSLSHAMQEIFDEKNINFLKLSSPYRSSRFDLKEYKSARLFVCNMRLKVQNIDIMFDLLLPRSCHSFIERAIRKMLQNTSNWKDPIWTKRMRQEVARAQIRVEAYLTQGQLSLKDVSKFQVGKILPLPKDSGQSIILATGNKALYKGSIGKVGTNLSIRIHDIIDTQDDANKTKNKGAPLIP